MPGDVGQLRCCSIPRRVLATLDWNGRPEDLLEVEFEVLFGDEPVERFRVKVEEDPGAWRARRWFTVEEFRRLEDADSSSPGCP